MVLLIVIAVALVLVAACVLVHYEVLRFTSELIPRLSISTRSKVLVVITGVFSAHVLEICLFAAGYAIMDHFPALGNIAGQFGGTGLDFFYFSITSYTTLGVGDLFPHGPLRLVAGLEALIGFVLIGWSASFTYLAMEKFWQDEPMRKTTRRRGDPKSD